MAGSDKYLRNRDGRFFARVVIPKDLRSFLDNKTEIHAPLGPDRRTAKAGLATAVAEIQARIAVAERRAMIAKGEAITPGRYPLPVDQIALRNYNERLTAITFALTALDTPASLDGVGSGFGPRLKRSEVAA
jgi:hypothetical protein